MTLVWTNTLDEHFIAGGGQSLIAGLSVSTPTNYTIAPSLPPAFDKRLVFYNKAVSASSITQKTGSSLFWRNSDGTLSPSATTSFGEIEIALAACDRTNADIRAFLFNIGNTDGDFIGTGAITIGYWKQCVHFVFDKFKEKFPNAVIIVEPLLRYTAGNSNNNAAWRKLVKAYFEIEAERTDVKIMADTYHVPLHDGVHPTSPDGWQIKAEVNVSSIIGLATNNPANARGPIVTAVSGWGTNTLTLTVQHDQGTALVFPNGDPKLSFAVVDSSGVDVVINSITNPSPTTLVINLATTTTGPNETLHIGDGCMYQTNALLPQVVMDNAAKPRVLKKAIWKRNTGLAFATVNLPSEFLARWTPPFTISRDATGFYKTNITAASLKPNTGVVKFISPTGNDTTGDGSFTAPYMSLQKAYDMGADTIYMLDGLYTRKNNFTAGCDPNRNLSIISYYGEGKAIWTRAYDDLVWVQQAAPNNNVYMATLPATKRARNVIDLTAPRRTGEYLKNGFDLLPIPLTNQTSIENVQANAGSFYENDAQSVYVRTHNDRAPDSSILVTAFEAMMDFKTNSVTLYYKDLEMWGEFCIYTNFLSANTATLVIDNCAARFANSNIAAARFLGIKNSYNFNLECTDSGKADLIGYSGSVSAKVRALEVGCTARRAGYNITNGLNYNAFTSHNETAVVRLNGVGLSTAGPVTADVLGAYTFNCNVTSGNSTVASNTLTKAAFNCGTVSDFDGTTASIMWLLDCKSVGPYYDRVQASGGSIYSDSNFVRANNRDQNTISPYTP